jgi:hypothetical protein
LNSLLSVKKYVCPGSEGAAGDDDQYHLPLFAPSLPPKPDVPELPVPVAVIPVILTTVPSLLYNSIVLVAEK